MDQVHSQIQTPTVRSRITFMERIWSKILSLCTAISRFSMLTLALPGRLGLEYHDPTSHLPQYAVGLCICERGSWRWLDSFGTRATKYLFPQSWTMDKGWDQGDSSLAPLGYTPTWRALRKARESPCVERFLLDGLRLCAWLVNGLDGLDSHWGLVGSVFPFDWCCRTKLRWSFSNETALHLWSSLMQC